ncbi:hypothetical protein [Capnocytophaga leadbetteri]|uniref:hypothetical protein n=1 Tax=Capnocytophaga leadbetteri TaxID=327575 RepID=UPI0028E90F54|nr:hypothetical protein [Capnocytophaga leadbetteri]
MTKEELISKIEELILKGQELKNSIYLFKQDTFFNYYKSSKEEEYKKWVQSIKRLIDTMFPSSKERLKPYENNISPENHMEILGILQGIREFPYEPKNEIKEKSLDGITINNTQNNIQNNTQQVILNIFIEAIRDEITGKELKELKGIMKDYEKNPEKTKSTLLEKIKGFGKDVLSNIMANIITNPDFYSTFLN